MASIIVIGAGPAGIGVAATLSRHGHRDVVVLAGANTASSRSRSLGRWLLTGDRSRVAYRFGRGVGGGALVNAGLVGPFDGRSYPFAVRAAPFGALSEAIAGGDPAAVGVAALGATDGDSPAAAMGLDALVDAGRVEVRCERAVKLIFDGGRVVGVATETGIHRSDVVFVAAGALATPILLADSGVDDPRLGEGLVDHPALAITVPSSRPRPFGAQVGDDRRAELAPRQDRPHPPGCVIPLVSDLGDRGMIYCFDGAEYAASGQSTPNSIDNGPWRGLMIALLDSRRRGSIRRGASTGAPQVDLGTAVEFDRMLAIWQSARRRIDRLDATAPLDGALVDQWGTRLAAIFDSPTATHAWIRRATTGLYHATGSTSMLVDGTGAIDGVPGLRIADLSRLGAAPMWPMLAAYQTGCDTAAGFARHG